MKSPQFTKTFRWALRLIPVGIALGCGSVIAAASQSQDPNLLVEQGRQLFSKAFKVEEGFGYRLGSSETVIVNRQLGPDAKTCLECHAQGGFGGAGGDRKNVWVGIDAGIERRVERANIRNSTAIWGDGAVQALAQEMTADLQHQRKEAIAQAKTSGQPVTIALVTKGVSFGSLTASPDGSVNLSKLEGVDKGLVVKAFHAKGTRETIRRFTLEAAWRHHGLESPEILKRRYPMSGNWESYDHDGDGVINEITTDQITALTVFQALLPMPQTAEPTSPVVKDQMRKGEKLFAANCATCHVSTLALNKPEVTIEGAMGQPPLVLNLRKAYGKQPPVLTSLQVPLYSDLKRHNMGAELAEKNGQLSDDKVSGVAPNVFITPRLWGVASSAPYLHDGRATTLEEAILAHGGEAETSRNTYKAMSQTDQEALVTFLKCLKPVTPK
jgi:mono/diheme cytochrome c family protein